MTAATKRLLFLCTGNYYRSRFAEAAFNHAAGPAGISWRAFSKGLAIHMVPEGRISIHTLQGLAERGIPLHCTGEDREQLAEPDLESADLVIALKEAEHRPMIEQQFPRWADRIRYWHVSDIDACQPTDALREIERLVRGLIAEMTSGRPASQSFMQIESFNQDSTLLTSKPEEISRGWDVSSEI
ncbi:MAG: low molecular weight phosphatase family protein [Verrucomicrobiota bacterium]